MLYSKLFGKTSREVAADIESTNGRLLIQGGFVSPLAAGIYSYLPLGLRVLKNIERIIREELDAIGCQEVLMPALQPKENWLKTERWDAVDVLFKLQSRFGKEYGLGSTHEEIITPLVQQYVKSYKDLPMYVYQIQTKFRDEKRAKSGVLRGREFGMKDLYSFNTTHEGLEKFYELAKQTYMKIYERVGLTAYAIEASGGDFTKKYSHEFAVITPAGEDMMVYCEKCGWAQNIEISEKKMGEACPECEGELKVDKDVEAGNIFDLGTRFTEAFKFTVTDESGQQQPVYMGCYGIGTSRVLGTIVEASHDERGMIWPKSVAPYQVHLLHIGKDEAVTKEAEKLYAELEKQGIEVLYDDRDESAGVKLADADLIGLPIRLVISERTLKEKSVEYKERAAEEAELVKLKEVLKKVS